MDNFLSPPPSAAGIIEYFLTIIILEINTDLLYGTNLLARGIRLPVPNALVVTLIPGAA